MPRKRDPRRDEAFGIWKKHNGDITNRSIAKKINVPEKTISAWKSRDKWNVVLQNNDRSTTKGKQSTSNNDESPKKRGPTKKQQKNRSGNPNPSHKFPKHNSFAEKHGFYKRVLPEELMQMFDEVEDKISEANMLWDQIKLQYLAIMRSQSIMFVESKDEMIKELKKEKTSIDSEEYEWEFQFAWERQAQFLNAQSRAISELRNSINQFIRITDETDERRLKLEQMQLGIEKTKAEIENLSGNNDNQQAEDWVEALKQVADKRRKQNGEADE
ncbi:phage terminase small subunit [Virgibacillus sp. FSP13]